MENTNALSKLLFAFTVVAATVMGLVPMKAFAATDTLVQTTEMNTLGSYYGVGFFILFTFALVGSCLFVAAKKN